MSARQAMAADLGDRVATALRDGYDGAAPCEIFRLAADILAGAEGPTRLYRRSLILLGLTDGEIVAAVAIVTRGAS